MIALKNSAMVGTPSRYLKKRHSEVLLQLMAAPITIIGSPGKDYLFIRDNFCAGAAGRCRFFLSEGAYLLHGACCENLLFLASNAKEITTITPAVK